MKMDLPELITKHNPFAIKRRGQIKCFENYEDCYLFVFREIIRKYPRGFIDVPLLIHELTECKLGEAYSLVRKITPLLNNELYLYLDFRDFPESTFRQLSNLFRALHTISETSFDESAWLDAYNWFFEFMIE